MQPEIASDKKWQAESNVRTLTEADAIKKMPVRLKAAKIAAKRMAAEEQLKAKAMEKIANSKTRSKKKGK